MNQTNKYEVAFRLAAENLTYALERLNHARVHETGASIARWAFRVESARQAFDEAQRELTIDAIGVAS